MIELEWNGAIGKCTHVAPARTSSIILGLVNRDNIDKKRTVETMITIMRADTQSTAMQMMTGARRRDVMRHNIKDLAVRFISEPE